MKWRRGWDSNPCGTDVPRALKARALTTLPPRHLQINTSISLALKMFTERFPNKWLFLTCNGEKVISKVINHMTFFVHDRQHVTRSNTIRTYWIRFTAGAKATLSARKLSATKRQKKQRHNQNNTILF